MEDTGRHRRLGGRGAGHGGRLGPHEEGQSRTPRGPRLARCAGFTHDFVKRKLKRQGQQILDEGVSEGVEGVERIRGTGATVAETHLRGGRTSNQVIALSEEIGAGLLIVGTRGLGTVQRILMGS